MEFRGSQAPASHNTGDSAQRQNINTSNPPTNTTHNQLGGGSQPGKGMQIQQSEKGKVNAIIIAVLVVVVLAVLGGAVMFAKGGTSGLGAVQKDKYQAIFLTNGQVYFGKISDGGRQYVKLSNIYYLQVQQTVQPEEKKDDNQQPQVSLAKLGSELHGPEDVMYIAKDQVLFWENLKNDGKVVQAIQTNKK